MLYRASHLGQILAIAVTGEENELDVVRQVTLSVTTGDDDIRIVAFEGQSLFRAIAAAQAMFSFEAANLCDPYGFVRRVYIQDAGILAVLEAQGDEAISYRATLGHCQLTVLPFEEDDDDSYARLLEVRLNDGSSAVFKGANIHECVAAVKRNLKVVQVLWPVTDKRHQASKI